MILEKSAEPSMAVLMAEGCCGFSGKIHVAVLLQARLEMVAVTLNSACWMAQDLLPGKRCPRVRSAQFDDSRYIALSLFQFASGGVESVPLLSLTYHG